MRKAHPAAGPFTVYGFSTIRTDAHVERERKHFMTVNTHEGADRLAALLNEAVALADTLGAIGIEPEFSRIKIAHAVAEAMGCKLDWSESIPVKGGVR